MGLNHEFYLVPFEIDILNNNDWKNESKYLASKVVIDDVIIQYIYDTLEWIPSYTPSYKGLQSSLGLNYHGRTIFNKEAYSHLKGILSSWKNLFEYAPPTFKLTGEYIEGEGLDDIGEYEQLTLDKNKMVTEFNQLLKLVENINTKNFILYHEGI